MFYGFRQGAAAHRVARTRDHVTARVIERRTFRWELRRRFRHEIPVCFRGGVPRATVSRVQQSVYGFTDRDRIARLTERVAHLEAALAHQLALTRQANLRADVAEASQRRAWSLATSMPARVTTRRRQ
jgi:hypothetical protein